MATSEAKEIKKQETLVRFSIISYKTRLRVLRMLFINNETGKNNPLWAHFVCQRILRGNLGPA